MRSTPELDARTGLEKLATYPFHIASWIDDTGYPVSVAVTASIDPRSGAATFARADWPGRADRPRGVADRIAHPAAARLRLRRAPPRDGVGPRVAGIRPDSMTRVLTLIGRSAWGWDESEVPFFEYSERSRAALAQVLRRALRGERHARQAAAALPAPSPCARPGCRS